MDIYPPGTMIGQYEIVSQPLMGGMGIVYFCIDHQNDLPVALKTFKPEFLPDREARDRFLREGATWVGLGSHPHIVRCYEVEYIDPTAFLVLELVAKEPNLPDASLRSWLVPGHPVPIEHSLLFGLQIARGMQHACEKLPGFVHRDLKPENVLVGADKLPGAQINRLRVTDFGLARVLEWAGQSESGLVGIDQPVLSQGSELFFRTQLTHGIVGTPPYMAPEQWQGKILGVWTDMYALGCILYELLAGQRASPGQTLREMEVAHCNGRLRPLPNGLPGGIVDILQRCLRLARKGRYEDWTELIAALEGAFVQQTGHAAPATTGASEINQRERVLAGFSYNAIGASYIDLGKAEVAYGYFERALAAGKDEGDHELVSMALHSLGIACLRLGDARRAIGYFEQVLAIYSELGYQGGVGVILGSLGSAYGALGDVRRMIGYYDQALAIAREIGDPRSEGNSLNNLGSAYKNLGDAQQAIGYHEQALIISHEIGDRRGEGMALGALGIAHKNLGDAQRAIVYAEQALAIAREIGDRYSEGNDLCNLGIAYKNLGDAQQSIGYYEQALAIFREISSLDGEGSVLTNLGNAYLQLGDAQQAIVYSEQALEIAREVGHRGREGEALGHLGLAYFTMGELPKAIKYYELALAISREIGNRGGERDDLGNLGTAYFQLGDFRLAIKFYEQSLAITREIGDRGGERISLGNLGLAYSNLGEIRKAIGYHEKALTIASEIRNADGVATNLSNLALLYVQLGEPARALPLAQQAAQIFTQIESPKAHGSQQIVALLQGSGVVNSTIPANTVQAASEAFQRAQSPAEMRTAVHEYPFMTNARFIQAVEKMIGEKAAPGHKKIFKQHLFWLRQIAGK